jgi:hypothetical protein
MTALLKVHHDNLEIDQEYIDADQEIEEEECSDETIDNSYIRNVVVYGTNWTTETIFTQLVRGNIELTPNFQRRDAWNIQKKSRLIESLILGLPVPQIVLAERDNVKGKFIVLDGKQRLLSIFQFYGKSGSSYDNFKLTGLEILKKLNGSSYEDLQNSFLDPSLVNALDNQSIRTTIIRNWQHESFLYTVFSRLNTENAPLSSQELRKSLNPGEFTNFIDRQSAEIQGLRLFFGSKEPDFRMRDTQILLKYVAFQLFLSRYQGNLNQFLNEANKKLNKLWLSPKDQQKIKNVIATFEKAINLTIQIFGEQNFARIWLSDKNKYERRRNPSVLEMMLFYFSDHKIQSQLTEINVAKKKSIERAFQDLCGSEEFLKTMRSSTQNIPNTSTRLKLWGEKLKEVLNIDFDIPQLVDGKFIYQSQWQD